MKKVVSSSQMNSCDKYAEEILGIPLSNLMDRAAKALLKEFQKVYLGGKIAVICGGGNNGGDGAAFARLAQGENINCDTYFFYREMSPLCIQNYQKIKDMGLIIYENPETFDFTGYDYIIDCLFGTGISREVTGVYALVIEKINSSKAFVLSCDMPSGLSADSGKAQGISVNADITVTFAAYKYGQLLGGRDYCGKIIVKDIGIPVPCGEDVYEDADIAKFFPKRKTDTHKGSYGKLAIIGGSGRYFGAAQIAYCGAAALMCGAGICALCVPHFLAENYRKRIFEAIIEYLPDNGENAVFDEETLKKISDSYSAISLGMGMGESEDTFKIAAYLIRSYGKKLLLDADALNSISKYGVDILSEKKQGAEIIITPHIKEFSRLTGLSVPEIADNPIYYARQFAAKYGITVLLKGATTIITDGVRTALNITGTPAMAKGGSGDVLSGICGSLLAQGHGAFDSAVCGTYIHGRAGETAAAKIGEYGVLARDICKAVPKAVKNICNS